MDEEMTVVTGTGESRTGRSGRAGGFVRFVPALVGIGTAVGYAAFRRFRGRGSRSSELTPSPSR